MIQTERLILRGWRADDVTPFHAMGQDAEVMRNLGPFMSRDDCERVVERMQAMVDSYGSCFWALERRDTGAFIGFCGIKPGAENTPIEGQPEIGWRLARQSWGYGYAREAAEACIADAWTRGEDHVVAITTPANTRSWGLMERLGMHRLTDGDFTHPAVPEDSDLRQHITYRIDRP